jgi:hypothetical protein
LSGTAPRYERSAAPDHQPRWSLDQWLTPKSTAIRPASRKTAAAAAKPKPPRAGLRKRLTELQPGAILRYVTNSRTPPKLKPGEIFCHNHIAHLATTTSGENGFRFFIADASPGHGWELCPCGGMPHLGEHYAMPDHVAYHRKRIAAGKPMTMFWPPTGLAVPPGFKRVGKDMIAEQTTDTPARRGERKSPQ